MTIISLDNLSKAIVNRLGLDIGEARKKAEFIMDLFGYQDRIIDNVLSPVDRQLFYTLQKEGMLSTQRDELTLYDGRLWRIHYWLLKKKSILKYANDESKKTDSILSAKQTIDALYDSISDGMWTTRKTVE